MLTPIHGLLKNSFNPIFPNKIDKQNKRNDNDK